MKKFRFVTLMLLTLTLPLLSCKESKQEESSSSGPRDPACSSKATANCTNDCEVVGTACVATSTFCAKSATQAACGKMTSCSWNASTSSCSPAGTGSVPTASCSANTTQAMCASSTTCSWTSPNGPCIDNPASTTPVDNCASLDQTNCLANATTYNCLWGGSSCYTSTTSSGPAASCEMITTPGLCTAPTCQWNGTSCVSLVAGVPNPECDGLQFFKCVVKFSTCSWKFLESRCIGR